MNPNGDNSNEGTSGVSSAGPRKEDNLYAKIYNKDGAEVDLTKNSLSSGGKYEKVTEERKSRSDFFFCLVLSV